MDRVHAAARRAEAVEAEGGDPAPHLIAIDRMGRAMRLALNLRRRFAGEARAEAVQRVQVRKERLKDALTPAIRIHADFRDRQELEWELAHRLETEAEASPTSPSTSASAAYPGSSACRSMRAWRNRRTCGRPVGKTPR